MGCSICWMGWLKSRAQNSILVPPERQGPKYLSRPLLPARMCIQQEAGLEVEELGLDKGMTIWDVGIVIDDIRAVTLTQP